MTVDQLQSLLKKYGIKPSDKLGQNFLLDDIAVQDIVDCAGVKKTDAVLEIGPGIGNLTKHLLDSAAFVLAVEKDEKMYPMLRALKKEHSNFRFEIADILHFNFSEALSEFTSYKVVANVPYYITGKIIQTLIHAPKKPESITILIQKEVAENIVAEPGGLNLLGISVQLVGIPKVVLQVPARSFYPSPKVDSAVVHIEIPKKPPYILSDEKAFFGLLRACFAGKRKQLHNTLQHNYTLAKEQVDDALKKSDISPHARPQELSIPQWIKLYETISEK